jgi:hypothetical protein
LSVPEPPMWQLAHVSMPSRGLDYEERIPSDSGHLFVRHAQYSGSR